MQLSRLYLSPYFPSTCVWVLCIWICCLYFSTCRFHCCFLYFEGCHSVFFSSILPFVEYSHKCRHFLLRHRMIIISFYVVYKTLPCKWISKILFLSLSSIYEFLEVCDFSPFLHSMWIGWLCLILQLACLSTSTAGCVPESSQFQWHICCIDKPIHAPPFRFVFFFISLAFFYLLMLSILSV